jgi:N-acyl-D-amino-acid deacylase
LRIVINNGTLIDPGNNVNAKLNLAVENGIVSEIAAHPLKGDVELDAEGLVVAPGFIDLHIHEGAYIPEEDRFDTTIFECLLRMGVTTAVGGNCGIGTEDPGQYLAAVNQHGLPINLGMLVPHETLRLQVDETNRYLPAPDNMISKMQELADIYLSAGCLGISFGIRYIPGISHKELLEISRVVKKHHGFIAAHLRDDADQVMAAAAEFIEIGKVLQIPVQVSHIGSMAGFGQMREFLDMMDHQAASGLDITADCYPYDAFSTFIGATTYDDGFIERYGIGYDAIEVAEGPYRGHRLTEALFHELRKSSPRVLTIAHVMKEPEITMAMKHPRVMAASDGLINDRQGHPRVAGTFPRMIGEYVRERKLMTLSQAIEKMTVMPARRLGIRKGTLETGADADLTVFNPHMIKDKATFRDPLAPPQGIKWTFINGRLALQDGELLVSNAGKGIRPVST